jgi:HK97 family phage portal protein
MYNLTGGGANVNQATVQGISAWSRGRSILSNTLAGLPKNLYEKTSAGPKIVDKHQSLDLIKLMANSNLNAYQWHDYMMGTAIDYGNAYSLIHRDENARPMYLSIIHPDKVTVEVWDNAVMYKIKLKNDSNETVTVDYSDMYHIMGSTNNGYVGTSTLKANATSLGLSLSMNNFAKDLYDSNTNLEGYIKNPGRLDAEVIKKVRESWQSNYGGTGTSSTAFLDQGMEYVPLSMTPENAQLIQLMRYTNKNIATILGIPAHMINEMDEAKYNNVELTGIEFVKYSLLHWVNKFEIQNNKLLRESEQGTYKWKYNVNGLMRGDSKSRAEFYNTMINIAALTPNQVRQLEDLNPYEGGDEYYIQGNNMIPVNKLDEHYNKGGTNE